MNPNAIIIGIIGLLILLSNATKEVKDQKVFQKKLDIMKEIVKEILDPEFLSHVNEDNAHLDTTEQYVVKRAKTYNSVINELGAKHSYEIIERAERLVFNDFLKAVPNLNKFDGIPPSIKKKLNEMAEKLQGINENKEEITEIETKKKNKTTKVETTENESKKKNDSTSNWTHIMMLVLIIIVVIILCVCCCQNLEHMDPENNDERVIMDDLSNSFPSPTDFVMDILELERMQKTILKSSFSTSITKAPESNEKQNSKSLATDLCFSTQSQSTKVPEHTTQSFVSEAESPKIPAKSSQPTSKAFEPTADFSKSTAKTSESSTKPSKPAADSSEFAAKTSKSTAKSFELALDSSKYSEKASEIVAKTYDPAAKKTDDLAAKKTSNPAAKMSKPAAKTSELTVKTFTPAAKKSEPAADSSKP